MVSCQARFFGMNTVRRARATWHTTRAGFKSRQMHAVYVVSPIVSGLLGYAFDPGPPSGTIVGPRLIGTKIFTNPAGCQIFAVIFSKHFGMIPKHSMACVTINQTVLLVY